jgi:DNA-binding MarR family transcriptional regulator
MAEKNDIEKKKVELLSEIKSQFDIIISLLAIQARGKTISAEEVKKTITKKRRDTKKIIKSFNSCNGKTTLSEIAKKHKIDQGAFSRAIDSWEKEGFLIKIEKKGNVFPKTLIYLK